MGACGSSAPVAQTWGSRGRTPGRFGLPRGIGIRDGFVYVIDRTGRIQKLTTEGEFVKLWELPKYDNGTPTGVSFDPDGNLWVPDTHNSRILRYSPEGELLDQFGEFGKEPGKFIYPTDMIHDDNDLLYIAEYGNFARIQVFTAEGSFVRTWGHFGDQPEQFSRPMAIVAGPDGLLYVADAGNHRIAIYTKQGELQRLFGERGDAPGQFDFPYDLDIDAQGHLFVCDYSNHRLQQLTNTGQFIREWGGLGSATGQLFNPWGIALTQTHMYIADTRNHRIVVYPKPQAA